MKRLWKQKAGGGKVKYDRKTIDVMSADFVWGIIWRRRDIRIKLQSKDTAKFVNKIATNQI